MVFPFIGAEAASVRNRQFRPQAVYNFSGNPVSTFSEVALFMNAVLSRWELAAETIAVKIRWFGIFFGYFLVNLDGAPEHRLVLNAILALGVGYALFDTVYSLRGQIFLRRWPLLISFMEALFIAM